MSTAGQIDGTGIFAKLVAGFLVKWIKKTHDGGPSLMPALSATPTDVTGRPERDRSRETAGAHTGAAGPRASGMPAPVSALHGDDYGAHRGASARVCACDTATYDPVGVERRLAAMWDREQRRARRDALRAADPDTLRKAGLTDCQVRQAGQGRVPQGYQLEQTPGTGGSPAQYQLSPTSAQGQCNCNAVNDSISVSRFGAVTVISLPVGGRQVTIVLGGGAAMWA